jgi:hypothetical protein
VETVWMGTEFVEVSRAQARETRNRPPPRGSRRTRDSSASFLRRRAAWFLGEAHGHGAGVQIEPDFGRAGLATQNESRAQRRMSGEGQFFLHGEDAHADSAILFRRASPGRMKVVSERFISRAKACICSLLRPRPSRKTASELPAEGAVGKHIDLHH